MGLKSFYIDFQNIGKQEFLRIDVNYRYFFDIQNAIVYDFDNLIELKYVLKELPIKKVSKGDLENEEYLIDIGNIERRFNNLINLEKVTEVGSDKNILQDGDIVIPKMQPQMGNIFLNKEHKRFLGSTELLEYSISEKYNHLFVYYLITSNKFLSDLAKLESGKTHRRVNPIDLLKIKIPLIPKEKQDQIVAQIEPIEQRIKELKAALKDPQLIINEVFAREFGFDLEKFEELKKQKFFEVEFAVIDKTSDLKFSVSTSLSNKINFQIPNVKYFKIKNIAKKIFAGGDMPKDFSYEKDQEYKYPIFSNGKENLGLVGYCKNPRVKEMATTVSARGTIGFAVARSEPYFPIVRLISIIPNENIILNEYLANVINFIDIEKSGNTIAQLTTPMVENIKIPVPEKKIQQRIVDEIKAELDKQEEIKKQIEEERNKIDQIIEQAVLD